MAVPHSRYSYPLREDSELSFAAYSLCRTSYLMVSIAVEYPARVSSVDWSVSVGFTPAVNGGILSL